MKQRSLPLLILFALLLTFAVYSSAFADHRPGHTAAAQCSDGVDNDSDGKKDKDDPDCIAGKLCEDGTATCNDGDFTGAAGSGNDGDFSGAATGINSATDFPLKVKLENPLKVDSIQDAIKLFMDAVVKIAIPFIVVFFIWSGIQFILAQGKPEAIKKAKAMFWNTLIGTLLILGAWAITDAIVGTINSIAS